MRFLAFCLILTGCATGAVSNETRIYNHEDRQDPKCWRSYGAEWGYCAMSNAEYESVRGKGY